MLQQVENGTVAGLGRFYAKQDRAEALAQTEYDAAVADWLGKVEPSDVLDELTDCEAELQAAISKGDAACIGRIVLNVRRAYAMRLADRDYYGPDCMPRPKFTTQQAAALALFGEVLQ